MENQFIQFRQKFIDEAAGLIEDLERNAMMLENQPDEKELVEAVFRCMHTLKGTSSMYGFDNIAEITHQLENIYDLVRNGDFRISSPLIQITLVSADYIKNLLNNNDEVNSENKIVQQNISASIQQMLNNADIKESNKNNRKAQQMAEGSFATWQITFIPEETIITRSINLIYTFADLFSLGQYQIVQNETYENVSKFTIFLYTNKGYSDIEDALIFIMDYCKLSKIADFDIFDNESLEKHNIAALSSTIETAAIKNVTIEEVRNEIINSLTLDGDQIKPASLIKSRIGVETSKLDELMYLVSELITTNSQLTIASKNVTYSPLKPLFEKIDKLSRQFRNNTISLRLVPINEVIVRFQRLVRDLSVKLGKEVELVTQGTETELDKSTIDALTDPLMHIIRNSIDHGIELPEIREEQGKSRKGIIKISAYHSGNFVFIQIHDDGKGIDTGYIRQKAIEKGIITDGMNLSKKELYELIFKPGFSTAETLTQVSGRGVGMDVVKKAITELRGQIDIHSEPGAGTTFTLKLHQTIAILDTMLFRIDDMYFMVPFSDVEECSLIEISEFERRKNTSTIAYGGKLIPYIDMYELFKLRKAAKLKRIKIIVINRQDGLFAIAADSIIGEHQAVLKNLGEAAKRQKYISLASVLGDGNLAYMLDMNAIQNVISN